MGYPSPTRATVLALGLCLCAAGLALAGTGAVVAQQADLEVGITASPPGDGSFGSESNTTISVGVIDTSGTQETGVSGDSVEVTVTDPGGTEETFTVTTGPEGSDSITYDFSGRPDGTYTVSAEHLPSGTTGSAQFRAGPTLDVTTNKFRDRPVFENEETTVAVLARNGAQSESGLPVDLSVTRDGTTVESTSDTTDSDGFATVSFTPSASGEYVVQAETTVDGETIEDSQEFPTTPVAVETDFFTLDEARAGSTAGYGAFLRTESGPLANADVSVQFTDSATGDTVVDRTVTTGQNGFLVFDYQAPATATDLDVTMQTASGESVALGSFEDSIDVESEDTQNVSVSASLTSFAVAPGETTSVEIEATDSGAPVTNQQVEVLLRYGFDGAPALSRAVTTDDSGTATVQVTIPEDAPAPVFLDGSAVLEYQGEVYESSLSGQLRETSIDFADEGLRPGQSADLSLTATDQVTGDPVAGVPAQFDIQYSGGKTGSFATGSLTTDSSGSASLSVAVPDDITFLQAVNDVSQANSPSAFGIPQPDYPGTVSVQEDSAGPGESVSVTLDVPGDTPAAGMAYGQTDAGVPFTVPVQTGQPTSLPVPQSAEDDLRVEMWAAGGAGELYADSTSVSIDDGADGSAPSTLSVSLSASTVPAQQENVSVTVTDGTGSPVTGATVEITGLGLSETTDASGEATLPLSDPAPGEYTVSVSADGFADATATLTVRQAGAVPEIIEGTPASDTDGDGLLDDLNGNGGIDRGDAQALFNALGSQAAQDNAGLLDYNGNGDVDRGDVQALFQRALS